MSSPYAFGTGLLGRGDPVEYEPDVVVQEPAGPNPSTGCSGLCGSADTFTRTVNSGWGTSDTGHTWQTLGTLSVNGQAGTLLNYGEARLVGLTNLVQNGQMEVRFDVSIAGSGSTRGFAIYLGPMYFHLEGGTSNEAYIQRFGGAPDYTATVSYDTVLDLGITVTDGLYHVHAVVDATKSHVSFWKDGQSEPTSWLCEAGPPTNPFDLYGTNWGVGWDAEDWTSFYFAGMSSNNTITLDNLSITGFDRCSEYRFDNFDRSVALGWGTSTDGHVWYEHFDQSLLSVDGVSGVMHWPINNAYGEVGVWTGNYVVGPWNTAPSWEMTVKFRFTHAARAWGDPEAYLQFHTVAGTSGPANIRAYISLTNDGTYSYRLYIDNLLGGNSDAYDSVPIAPNTDCILKWAWDNTGVHKAKLWSVGSSEPDWMVSATGPTSLPNRAMVVAAQYKDTNQFGVADQDRYIYIDDIDFDYDGKPCYCHDGGGIDPFTRTVTINSTNGWGSGALGEWAKSSYTGSVGGFTTADAEMGADGTRAIVRRPSGAANTYSRGTCSLYGRTWTTPIDMYIDTVSAGAGSSGAIDINLRPASPVDNNDLLSIQWTVLAGGVRIVSGGYTPWASSYGYQYDYSDIVVGEPLRARWLIETTQMRMKVWPARVTEPEVWNWVYAISDAAWLANTLANGVLEVSMVASSGADARLDRFEIVGDCVSPL